MLPCSLFIDYADATLRLKYALLMLLRHYDAAMLMPDAIAAFMIKSLPLPRLFRHARMLTPMFRHARYAAAFIYAAYFLQDIHTSYTMRRHNTHIYDYTLHC